MAPRAEDLPIWQRHLQASWGVDGAELRLVVESIQAPPALVLAQAFPDARIDVYGDGLMSYGPTRVALTTTIASRIERLIHLDLLPDVPPLLLAEFDVPATIISTDAFAKVVAGLEPVPELPAGDARGTAILLGQYLSANRILSAADEQQLHLEMVQGAIEAGFHSLVFKPHPSAPELASRPLVRQARRLGAELTICAEPALAEAWFRSEQVGLVIGCFSTALFTAASLYQLPVARVGTRHLLNRLRPYPNSNRIPLTVVDAAVPDLADCVPGAMERLAPLTAQRLSELVRVVGYCMQPSLRPDMRPEAYLWLSAHWRSQRHYFTRRRLTELNLPGRIPRRRHPAKQALRSTLGPAAYRRLTKTWRRLRPG